MRYYQISDISPKWLEKRYNLPHYRAKLVYGELSDLDREFNDFDIIRIIFSIKEEETCMRKNLLVE